METSNPDVSVVISAYNAERTVLDAIHSALRQKGVRLEVLACDDASTDRTPEQLALVDDPRFRFFRNAMNSGPGITRDSLIERCSGEFIAFLDADDCYDDGRLSRLVEVARAHPGNLVFDDILECHDSPRGLVPYRNVHGRFAFRGWLGSRRPRSVSFQQLVSAKRLLVKPLLPRARLIETGVRHTEHRYGEDGLFLWRAVARGISATYVPEAFYRYRVTPGSLSVNPDRFLLVADCLATLSLEPINDGERQAVQRRASEFKALATLRSIPSHPRWPKIHGALRYFAGNPRRIPKWVAGYLRRQHYAVSRRLYSAPTR